MKKIFLALLAFLCVLCFFSCSKFDENYIYDGQSLIGKWCEKDYDSDLYTSYEFVDSDTVILTDYCYGIEFQRIEGIYSVDTNKLIIDVKNYDKTTTHYEHKFSITKKGELVVIYLNEDDQMTEEEMVLTPFENFNEGDSDLYGAWEDTANRGEYWTFNDNFTGTIANSENSYKMHFSVNDGKMYMAYEFVDGVKQNLVEFDYKIKGDTLTLKCKIDNQKLEYVFERK